MLYKNRVPVYFFTQEERESGYVGTETADVFKRAYKGIAAPADSMITAEAYGERVGNLFSVSLPPGSSVSEFDKLSFEGTKKPTHRIVSLKRYHNRMVVLAERMVQDE